MNPGPLALHALFPSDRMQADIASDDKEFLFRELVEVIYPTSPAELDRSAPFAADIVELHYPDPARKVIEESEGLSGCA